MHGKQKVSGSIPLVGSTACGRIGHPAEQGCRVTLKARPERFRDRTVGFAANECMRYPEPVPMVDRASRAKAAT